MRPVVPDRPADFSIGINPRSAPSVYTQVDGVTLMLPATESIQKPGSIFLLEDCPTQAEALAERFQAEGFSCVTFTSADKLLDQAGSLSGTPAVFVLDTDLGNGRRQEGLHVLQKLHALRRERGDDFYLAVLTSHPEALSRAADLGADLFLQKSSSVQIDSLEIQTRLLMRDATKAQDATFEVSDRLKARLVQELVRRARKAAADEAQPHYLYDHLIPESLQRLLALPSLTAREKDIIVNLGTLVGDMGSNPPDANRRDLVHEGAELLLKEKAGHWEQWSRRFDEAKREREAETAAGEALILQPVAGVNDVQIEFIDVSQALYHRLLADPAELLALSPETFEHLIADRLSAMGMSAKIIGHVNARDGGIDIVFCPRNTGGFPFLGAVQVKHHRSARKKTGPDAVRLTAEAVRRGQFNVGMIVTNTRFTPDAQWIADSYPALLRLRDFDDLMRWFRGNFSDEREWREIPKVIQLCRGLEIKIRD